MRRIVLGCVAALTVCCGAAEKLGTLEWANRAERPQEKTKGYLPSATVESQGGDSAKVAAWVKGLDALGGLHGFVVLRHGHLVAEGYWTPYARQFPHALNGLAGVVGAGLFGAIEATGRRIDVTDELKDALTAKDPAKALDEAWRVRDLSSKYDVMYYEQAISRRYSQEIGFNWEWSSAFMAGNGAGRKTRTREVALLGQLHLWKGDWFGKRLWNEAWAERYYRFFARPSGLRAALGERGQILAVSLKADLVVAINGDTAETERILKSIEDGLVAAFGDAPRPENASAAQALTDLCWKLSLPEIKELAKGQVPLGTTYDLPANRYGYTQFRLAALKKGHALDLQRKGCAQRLTLEECPHRSRTDFVFVDTAGKDPLFPNGKYRISATGGWQTPPLYRARLYLTESMDHYDIDIDFADVPAPVFTVTRGSEPEKPVVLKAKPAQEVCGVKRLQPRAEIVWTHPIRKDQYIGWPTVMRRRSGELIACYSGNREAHVCPYGRDELIRSFDGGETWTAKPEIFRNSIIDDRDCGITELRNGDLLAAWFSSTCFEGSHPKAYAKLPRDLVDAARGFWTSRSTDGGKTWEEPVGHRGSAPHGAVQLRDGRILFAGHAWNRADTWNRKNDPEGETCLMIEESTDNGRSWHVLSRVFPKAPFSAKENTGEPYLVETTDGRIIVFCRTSLPVMTQVVSCDGGKTWSEMTKTPIVGYPPHFLQLRNGKLLCSYVDRDTRHEMAVISDDQGRTWDVANRIFISKGPKTDMGYPSTIENDDGSLLTVYYQPETATEVPCLMATKWRMR